MLLAVFLLLLPPALCIGSRVKRQWGPSDFYQFEQWVNYVNRPRQSQFSNDGRNWGLPQYPNRNIQQHSAPNGWRLEQNHYSMNGYRQMAGFPQIKTRPPVVIETNVFRTNSRVPIPFSPSSGYAVPTQYMGARGFQPRPTFSPSTTTTSTTTTTPPTTTEDERERFIQTAVKEDIDNESSAIPITEATTKLIHQKESGDSEASMNTRPTTLETTTTTTTTAIITEPPGSDYNSVWTEGEPTSTFSATITEVGIIHTTEAIAKAEVSRSSTMSSVTETSVDNPHTLIVESSTLVKDLAPVKHFIPEAEESSGNEPSLTEMATSTTSEDSLFEDATNDFLTDIRLRSPPLPIDVAKRLNELGVSIDKM